jgi:hypothetical protein
MPRWAAVGFVLVVQFALPDPAASAGAPVRLRPLPSKPFRMHPDAHFDGRRGRRLHLLRRRIRISCTRLKVIAC